MDPGGRLSPGALANYFQEAAGNHAEHLGCGLHGLRERGLTWVLGRIRMRAWRWPRWREPVTVHTWPSGLAGLQAFRDFLLLDPAGNPLAAAVSTWLMIDTGRKRPVRAGEHLRDLKIPARPRALEESGPSLRPRAALEVDRFKVRWSAVDINQHANNVSFLVWALDAVPPAVLAARTLFELEIHYRAEAVLGDEIVVLRPEHPPEAGVFEQTFQRGRDGINLALARTTWR